MTGRRVLFRSTLPLDELYFALKPGSRNGGEVDYQALIDGRPQDVTRNPDGRYRLTSLPAGHFTIKAWVNSKNTWERPVDLKKGAALHVDLP